MRSCGKLAAHARYTWHRNVMGRSPRELPEQLGNAFTIRSATAFGELRGRLRGADLDRPFFGVRTRPGTVAPSDTDDLDPFERQRLARVRRAHEFRPRLRGGQFFSHETAASILDAPLPLERMPSGRIASDDELRLHVSTIGDGPLQRTEGVVRHRAKPEMTRLNDLDELTIATPATVWASLGTLPVPDLVALGDYFCRAWRAGVGRPTPGKAPLATLEELDQALTSGRRRGAQRLREALGWIREDSWSPRESRVRHLLVSHALPEPELNVDLFDDRGRFLGCVDMVYREARVIIEYHGMLHSNSWAKDVERIAALRAAGWTVIEVTSTLFANPAELVRRVSRALGR